MTRLQSFTLLLAAALALGSTLRSAPASAIEIAVSNYGNSTSAWPYAVAFEGGFYKKAGLDITGVRGSSGGTGVVRSLLAGDLPYAGTSLVAVLSAVKEGADLKIIAENAHTSSTFVWVVMPNSPINSIKDLKGKRISFTTPQSTSEMLDIMLLGTAGMTKDDAKLIAAGGYGPAMTLLEHDGVDAVALSEPNFTMSKGKYKTIARAADIFPPMDSDLSITSGKTIRDNPGLLRAINLVHRDATVFMVTHRKEAAALIEKVYKLGPGVVEAVLDQIIDHGDTKGVPYWGYGEIIPEDIDNLIEGLKLVGAFKGEVVNWRTIVDQSFLPDDLKRKLD